MKTYLQSVALAGYRSYDGDLERNRIDLRDINIIIGANGAGKSNLVSFLDMISHMMSSSLRYYVAKQGGAGALLWFGAKRTRRIQGELSIYDAGHDAKDHYVFTLEHAAGDSLFFAEEKMSYQDLRRDRSYQWDAGIGHTESRMVDQLGGPFDPFRRCLLDMRTFHFHDTTIGAPLRATSDVNATSSRRLSPDGGDLAAFLFRMKMTDEFRMKTTDKMTDHAYYRRIIRYIRMAMPQFGDFELEPDEAGNMRLDWRQKGQPELFGPHQFSDGALRFIALTTLLLQPPSTAPATIILDEPEIGLHPFALSLLASEIKIASQNSQIILTTQSSALLDEFSCEDIITADYDIARQCTMLRRHTEEELAGWIERYTLGELWEKNVLGGLPL